MLLRIVRCVTLLAVLVLPRTLRADEPWAPVPGKNNVGVNIQLGQKQAPYKGWYLYWPMEALKQPRMPMPYPFWPQQAAAAAPAPARPQTDPAYQPGANPPPLPLPGDSQNLPGLPGTSSWGGPYYPAPFVPVGYYWPAPTYWYGQ